jgi:uncharacterized protein (DUF1015 family)
MAVITPFRALRYDPAQVDVSDTVTQPYDKITNEMREHYYESSPYNLVRIILGKSRAGDHENDSPYTRASGFYREWRTRGILKPDPTPSLYPYFQTFTAPASNKSFDRKGFIALGKIEDYATGVVYRHEQTLAKPKSDRLNLLRATRAHFGQLFMLYSDEGEIETALSPSEAPVIDVTDEYGVKHQVWRIDDPATLSSVQQAMREQRLLIADGHHRYETALAYRDEQRALQGSSQPSAPHDWVMMTFVNMNSPGLIILPTHRVVHGMEGFTASGLRNAIEAYFRIEEVDASCDGARATGLLHEAGRMGTALLAVTASRCFLLHSPKAAGMARLERFSHRQQSLDVVQLHKCLLEGALNLSEESIRNQENISYLRDADEAITRVRTGAANAAFLMNPVRMEQVRDIAYAGEVLPQKSTDFYPKLLSGLAIYALD